MKTFFKDLKTPTEFNQLNDVVQTEHFLILSKKKKINKDGPFLFPINGCCIELVSVFNNNNNSTKNQTKNQ